LALNYPLVALDLTDAVRKLTAPCIGPFYPGAFYTAGANHPGEHGTLV
jgi:hypothetical protein